MKISEAQVLLGISLPTCYKYFDESKGLSKRIGKTKYLTSKGLKLLKSLLPEGSNLKYLNEANRFLKENEDENESSRLVRNKLLSIISNLKGFTEINDIQIIYQINQAIHNVSDINDLMIRLGNVVDNLE